jgi:hypothetical protein
MNGELQSLIPHKTSRGNFESVLKLVIEKEDGRIWTGLNWPIVNFHGHSTWPLGSMKL